MYLNTRNLAEKREELKQDILDSFLEEFEHYAEQTEEFKDILFDEEELENWKELWQGELDEIAEIDQVENEVEGYSGDNFEFGVTLISEHNFQEYCEYLTRDCGDISDDLPALIENNIDWSGIADDMRVNYTEVEYQGRTYLFI